jgi:hypothetical protein
MGKLQLHLELYHRIDRIIQLSDMIREQVSKHLIDKSSTLSLSLTQDLKEKC